MSRKPNIKMVCSPPSDVSSDALENERLLALSRYLILDTPPEDVFDDIVRVAATALKVPVALITLVDKDRQWFKAKTGIDLTETPRYYSFCTHTILHDMLMSVPDLSADSRFADNPFVIGPPHLRFYAGAPMLTRDGLALGTVCVLDVRSRVLKEFEAEILTRLCRLAMAQIEMRLDYRERVRLGDELRGAHLKLIETATLLETKFAQRTQALRVSENRFRTVVESLEEAILITNLMGDVEYANVRLSELTGFEPQEMIGSSFYERLNCSTAWEAASVRLSRCRLWQPDVWEASIKRKDGSEFWAELKTKPYLNENGEVVGTLCSILDISERKRYQEELTRQAFCDTLTNLPNRILFLSRLDQALEADQQYNKRTGLLFIDLDNFKIINDSLGHAAGDELLIAVCQRLQQCVRPSDLLARLGGDEFVILLDNLQSESEAGTIADNVAHCLKESISLRGRDVYTTASIGVALSDGGTADADCFLRQADIAMYRAKQVGKGGYFLFDKSMNEEARERLELESELRQAISANELRVHYQPIIDMQTGQVVQVEALVRWQHPRRGMLSPTKFIPIAEESGLIVPLGLWVLENACFEACRLDRILKGHRPITICVNLSTRQFYQNNLVEEISRVLRATKLPANRLKLEITESLMMDTSVSMDKLNRLKALGVLLAVDDFGTGYSSMSYIGRFPIDSLKIDQSFVAHLGRTSDARAIIEAMVMVGKALGLKITCEGVETAFQHEKLKFLDCDFGQGYHYSRPVAASDLAHAIEQISKRQDLAPALNKAA